MKRKVDRYDTENRVWWGKPESYTQSILHPSLLLEVIGRGSENQIKPDRNRKSDIML